MEKIKTLIVDDEKQARDGLQVLLKRDAIFQILALCKNGLEAIDFITNNEVDLVFLDIQMPSINGFEVLNSIPKNKRPVVVFVTAYDNYALKAFDFHAIDYLLKPFTDKRFYETLTIVKKAILTNLLDNYQLKVNQLIQNLNLETKTQKGENKVIHNNVISENRIVIKSSTKKIIFINLNDIEWIEAFDYYIKIHTKKETFLVRESLKNMILKLPNPQFLRIHKSSIINTSYIKELELIGNAEYELTLTNNDILKVSRTYKDNFNEFVNRLKNLKYK